MSECTVTKGLRIVEGSLDDYKKLCRWHYRDGGVRAYAAIFALKLGLSSIGVIVYTMPCAALELRNIATGGLFCGFGKDVQMSLINKNIRCIGRVIIEPRFRGLGLASRLVRETMVKVGVPIVEGLAVMGKVNSFFEKAGMAKLEAKMPARCIQLIEAFSLVGIEGQLLIDSDRVHRKIEQLCAERKGFIESQIICFLQSYGKRRYMEAGIERTEYVLSKLTARPVYYIWFNPDTEIRF